MNPSQSFISRVEALRIAKQILEAAEQERLEAADREAAIGFHDDDISQSTQ